MVAPYAGAGIEIAISDKLTAAKKSPPTRGRELKWYLSNRHVPPEQVAPYAGAGIEILIRPCRPVQRPVAPYAGAGIEIVQNAYQGFAKQVAPYAGAGIEILLYPSMLLSAPRRPLRGGGN